MDKLRVGVMGCRMGRHHAKAALDAESTTLAALADPNAAAIARFWEWSGLEPGALPVYDDYRTMIEAENLDAVAIALPTPMHTQASLFALEHEVHVLCEKPPTVDAGEMEAVAEAAAQNGLTYMFARQKRLTPQIREARERVLAGELGRVYHAESRWMRGRTIPFRGGWGVNKDHGGGVLLDLGIHQIDDAWFAMGCPQPVSVYAAMHCGMPHLAPDDLTLPYNADDATVGLIRFADGATLNFTVTFALNIDWHPEYRNPARPREKPDWIELRLYGDRAGLDAWTFKLIDGDVTGIRTRTYAPRAAFTRHPTVFAAQMSEFARAIRAGDEPLNSAQQAVALMHMLDAVKASAESGRSIEIKPL
jgi:predicted dehydrogenase